MLEERWTARGQIELNTREREIKKKKKSGEKEGRKDDTTKVKNT